MTTTLKNLLLASILFGSTSCAFWRDEVPDRVPVYLSHSESGALLVGAAAVDITPETTQYLGGFNALRKSEGVHDPLYARAIVIERGDLELAIVAVDLVGLMRTEVEGIKHDIQGIDPRHVIIASTHVHHSPDTMGLWGLPPVMSGSDPKYMERVKNGVIEAIAHARASKRPAEIGSMVVAVDPARLMKNNSRPGLVDPEVAVLHARERESGATIATLVELGCHPEAVRRPNKLVTADFPGFAVAKLERELGGVAIYVSGALGALVSPDRASVGNEDPLGWGAAQRIGERLADHAIEGVRTMSGHDASPALEVWNAPLYIENDNWRYDVVRWTGIVDRKVFRGGYFESEVNLLRIGDLAIATVPGEISPDLGLRIKHACGDRVMVIGLANDELGYLVPSWDYEQSYYDYERTLCMGPGAGCLVYERLQDLALLAHYRRK